jgi:hypothetical protein
MLDLYGRATSGYLNEEISEICSLEICRERNSTTIVIHMSGRLALLPLRVNQNGKRIP